MKSRISRVLFLSANRRQFTIWITSRTSNAERAETDCRSIALDSRNRLEQVLSSHYRAIRYVYQNTRISLEISHLSCNEMLHQDARMKNPT